MHLHENLKYSHGFQTLDIIFVFMYIAPTFIHACWCSDITSLHLRETWPCSMSSWHHRTILHSQLIVVGQWWRWSPSMMMRNLFKKFSQIADGVHKFAIFSTFVRYWGPSTCYPPIMNATYLNFIYSWMKILMSPPICIIITLHANVVTKVVDPTLNTITS